MTLLSSACSIQASIEALSSEGKVSSTVGSISYTQPSLFSSKGTVITSLTPTINGTVSGFSILPSLPAGLSIDANTGVISGTPTASSPVTAYTVSASSGGSTITATFNLEVPIDFAVSSTADVADATPGDESCATAGAVCTLRAAVQEASALTAGTLVNISIPAGTYTLSTTGLQITSRVKLTGAGSGTTIITAANAFPTVVNINTTQAVTIDGVAVKDGRKTANGALSGVGIYSTSNAFVLKNCEISGHNVTAGSTGVTTGIGLYWNGAVGSTFLMDQCTVSNNSRSNATASEQGYGAGAAFVGSGAFTIQNSIFSSNTLSLTGTFAQSRGAGAYASVDGQILDSNFTGNIQSSNFSAYGGGGLFAIGNITLTRNTFSSNTARYGGAVQFDGGMLNVADSYFSENDSLLGGDTVYLRYGTFDIRSSTFKGGVNKGELIYSVFASGLNQIKNSTFYSNGGSSNLWLSYGDYLLENVTSQKDYTSGVALNFDGDNLTVKNSIFDKNGTSSACALSGTTMISGGYNIARDGTCSALLTGTGDLQNTNPLLGGLSANGGSTFTMAIDASSPAYNLVPLGSCTLTTDQTASARPFAGACDAGAFEYQGVSLFDPYYSNVLVLMHCDGSLSDQKGNSITNNGVTISNTQSKFGTDSCSFNGASSYATISNALLASGTQPFTFEAWAYTTSATLDQGIGATSYSGACPAQSSGFSMSSSSYLMGTSSMGCYNLTSFTALSTSTWHHVAYVYDGINMMAYVDGVRVSSTVTSRTMISTTLILGRYYVDYNGYYMQGYIDEIRFTRGVARYVGPVYTIPTSAFPNQ